MDVPFSQMRELANEFIKAEDKELDLEKLKAAIKRKTYTSKEGTTYIVTAQDFASDVINYKNAQIHAIIVPNTMHFTQRCTSY